MWVGEPLPDIRDSRSSFTMVSTQFFIVCCFDKKLNSIKADISSYKLHGLFFFSKRIKEMIIKKKKHKQQ